MNARPSHEIGNQVRIASVAVATPSYSVDQAGAARFLTQHYRDRLTPRSLAVMQKVLAHPSIQRRCFALEKPEVLIEEDPDERVRRFTAWSVDLAARAAETALQGARLSPGDVTGVVVNTCTGYICPGIATYLTERLGLPPTAATFDLVGAGCAGAVPNLQIGGAMLQNGNGGAVLCVSVEICSATFEMGNDLSLIISNALFADGAGAGVLVQGGDGLRLARSATLLACEHREAIRYVHRHGRLHNQLSPALPAILGSLVPRVVRDITEGAGIRVEDIRHWAIHPGGAKVIDAIQESVGLSDEQLHVTRAVLAGYGNMSSATVWFELDHIMQNDVKPGDWCLMLGAGAGLSISGYLFRA